MDIPNNNNLNLCPGQVDPNLQPLLRADHILPGINQPFSSHQQLALQSPVNFDPLSVFTGDPGLLISTGINPTNFLTTPLALHLTSDRDPLFVAAGQTPSSQDYDVLLNPGVTTLTLSKDLAVSQIQDFLNRPDRLAQIKIAFGQDLDPQNLERILQDWQGSKLPAIEILTPQLLGQADGGFDPVNNKIYLASDLIERGNLSEIVPVIIEEIGHYLDSKIHPNGDAAGDEGEIFSKLVRGVNISASEYVTLIHEDDRATIILNASPVNIEQAVTTVYAIKAEKLVTFNGNSDLDGNPLDWSDDALVYGGQGFSVKGNSILPVKYDASGNPLKNSQGKLVLVDKAISVSAGYLQANVSGNASNKYAGLTPPQIVAAETVIVPLFADLKQQELNRKMPTGTPTITFNSSANPLNSATDWSTKFPPAGTATQPKVVRITGGGLNIPGGVNLSNYVIIVDNGDINFNGAGNLSNVTLVANNGNINLNTAQSSNLSVLASGTINQNSGARFGGDTLLANGTGNITFNGATKGITATDNLRVISAGNITFNGAQSTRGSFVAQGNFISNGSATIYGTVSSKQNITFNGALTFTYANIRGDSDTNPPVILASLVFDSGTSPSDKITNDSRISGTVTDASQIVALKAGFDSKPIANYTNVLSSLQNGSFSFTKAQLETIYGGVISDGSHTLHLSATDLYGNQSNFDYTFNLDTTIGTPILQLAVGSDTGTSNSDKITKISTPIITGSGDIGTTIRLTEGNTLVGQTIVGNDGKWQLTTSQLTNGTHNLTATASDVAGNISSASTPLNLVIDALVPQFTLSQPLDQSPLLNNTKLTGTVDGTGSSLASVSYRWDNSNAPITITPNAAGGFDQNLDFTGIASGAHTITLSATDIAGNLSTTSYNVAVNLDKAAPLVTLKLATDSGSNNSDQVTNNPTIIGGVTDPSGVSAVTVSLQPDLTNSMNITASLQPDGTFSLDQAALTQLNGGQLPDGNYQLYIQAVDRFGNTTAPQSLSFQLLTQALAPTNLQLLASSDTGNSNSDKITKNNQPLVSGNGQAGHQIQLFDGLTMVGETTVGNDGTWQITSNTLGDGNRTLTARSIDSAGNSSMSATALVVNIDTVAPNLQFTQQLAGIVLNGSARLQGQVTDANITSISYQFDGSPALTLPPGNQFDTPFDFTGINDGAHNLTVTATDIAGNTVARTYGITVARGNLLTLALLNDTGLSNSDGITSDINVRGQVADRTQISRLEFSLDGSTNFTDLTATLQLDGTFRLLPAQLDSLAGGKLNLGSHSLRVRGVLADGSPVANATLDFTYQAANGNRPSLVLAKASDTGVIGDLVTSAGTVDLIAKAAAGTSIALGDRTLVADANGIVTFTAVNLILGGNNFTLTTVDSNGETVTSNTAITRTNPDDVILTWNHIALAAIQRENTPPPAAARVLGMVHTAMYDAVNAIEQKYGLYRVDVNAPSGADEIAAAAQAAFKILAAIYPNQQAYFSAALDSSLLDGATAAAQAAGITLGNTVAANILAWRQQDGARTAVAYNPTLAVGNWQPDLPNFDGALLPQWGKVTTFGLTAGSQFRPAGAPSLTSAEYTQDFQEVKAYGARDSQIRTADQTQSALFWADGGGTYTPAGHWNDIAATAASISGKSILDNARAFAQLNIALADAGIAAWDAKYTYNTWRPITAIRQADQDGNSNTTADPNWVPLINTPPFPEYVSGHSTFSGAAAAVLTNAYGSNFSFNSGSVGLPDVTRNFTSFNAAAQEAGQSRIYGGIHFQFSNQDGLTLGKAIGDYVLANLLKDDSQNPLQVTLTQDTAAFGTVNRDRITTNAAITGKITLTQPNLQLQLARAGGQYVDVTNAIDSNGNFQIDATKLATILGPLTDKTYQLTFRVLDGDGLAVATNSLNFTLDKTAAQVELQPLAGATPTAHVTGKATDNNGGSSGRFKVDGGAWMSFSVLPSGNFDKVINPQGLAVGQHQLEVELADLAGNVTAQAVSFNVDNSSNIFVSPATNPGWGRVFSDGFSLAEGGSLIVQKNISVALGGSGQRTLDFDLTTSFDKSDVKSFGKDRVAVYLVDNNNQPIAIDATHPAGVPLFSLSETGAEIIPGLVRFDGTHVQIDVSNIAATSGNLVVQLLSQDGDSGSSVTVTNFTEAIDPQGTPGTSVSPAPPPVTPGAAAILDGYLATSNAQLLLSNVSVDKSTGKYTADLRVQNVGTAALSRNLAVLLTNLPTGVTVANSSGTHPAGSAYLNFDTAIQPGGLAAGGISAAVRVTINDPDLKAFSFKPVVLQGAMEPLPDLSGLATLTVKVGEKLDIPLQGELAIKTSSKLPTGQITGDSHLVFTPAPEQIGSYSFTLIARNGGTETRQDVTLNVVGDPITTTRVTGVIADTNQAGLANVLVELAGYQATTDVNGKFTIILPESSAGDTLKVYGQRIQGGGITYPFIAEKMGLLLGHDIYRGVNNQIERPIYLPTIDVSTGITINPGAETFVTNPRLLGAQVRVAANSLFDKSGNAFAGILSITEVPPSLTPAALPDNLHPDLVVTIQPGDMVFNTPALLTLENRAGYNPCLLMDLWSINPNTGLFDIVGVGRVSEDGRVIETIAGGIRNSSWHFFAPPPTIALNPNPDPLPPICPAPTYDFKSEVSPETGAVSDDRALVSYQSQGIARGVNLHYDSLRANPSHIFNINGSVINETSIIIGNTLVSAKITVFANGISQTIQGLSSGQAQGLNGGERIWEVGKYITASLYGDLSHLESGVYESKLDIGGRLLFPRTVFGSTTSQKGKLLVVNDSDSVFGGGWNVSGLQKLVINEDKSALLIDGNGSQMLFDTSAGSVYQSPAGDFSKLEKLADGTWQRTTKDDTRYQFNAQGLMISASDKEGNTTRHVYNGAGQIQQIIDPVGLATIFNYTGNRVTSIVDPAGRTTLLKYDSQGDLVSVTDPDGTKNQYGYDSRHQVTSSIDKNGQVKTGTYDEFGRAKTATREDGTIVQIKPIDVQGLLSKQQTTDLNNIIKTEALPVGYAATYVDANARTIQTVLDEWGYVVAQTDEVGTEVVKTYNDSRLVTSETDGRGNTINYQYDARGNVISTSEQITTSTGINADGNLFDSTVSSLVGLPGAGFGTTVAATGDINNDGITDVVTTNGSDGTFSVLLGGGQNSFQSAFAINANALNSASNINQLELEDINDDGNLDLIASLPVVNGGGYGNARLAGASNPLDPILVYLGLGNGRFASPNVLPIIAESDGFVTGDFNGDSKLDILVRSDVYSARANGVYPLVLYTGDGTGGFLEEAINIPGIDANSNFTGGLQTLAVDVNKDGRTEVVFNLPDRLAIVKYTNECSWTNSESYLTDFEKSRQKMISGEINGDGSTDIITMGSQEINVMLGQASGRFQVKKFNPFDDDLSFNGSSKLQIIDVNNDRKLDLVISGTDSTGKQSLKVYTLNAAGDLVQQGNATKLPTVTGRTSTFQTLADINGDSTPELLMNVSGGQIGVVKNKTVASQTFTLTKSYTYDSRFNQLTSETDELGRQTLYDLDANTGKVLKTTHIIGQLDTSSGETNDVITSYTYTSSGQLDLLTDALGHVTDYDYDVRGSLVQTMMAKGTADEIIERMEYDLAGNQTADIDALGRRTTYIYNSTNMLLKTTDALGGTTTYNYDKMGRQTSITDALGHVTKMTYDSRGQLATIVGANDAVNTSAYDNNGNLLSTTDALGRVTSNKYDARDRLVSVTAADGGVQSIGYDLNDNQTFSIDTLGNRTRQLYDSRDRLSMSVDALGNQTKYGYDAANQLISITDAKGRTSTYQYDELGRQIAVVDALGHVTRTEYDKLGDVTATIDANGNRTEYTYDALNRRIQVKDAQGHLSKTIYDKVGNILTFTDALNHSSISDYDVLNRQILSTDALGHITARAFDAVGNILSQMDALGRITVYSYDNLSRLVTTTNALGQSQSVVYDLVNNRLSDTNELGQVTGYIYDSLNRRTKVTDPTGQTQTTVYDTEGNFRSTTDGLGNTTNYAYDALNRQIKVTDAKNGIVSTIYDVIGKVSKITDSVGNSTSYSYDAVDQLLTDTNQLGFTRSYVYDAVGNKIEMIDRNGRRTDYGYDSLNQKTEENWIGSTGQTLRSISYTYDAVGNMLTANDPDSKYTYGYDALNRLAILDNAETSGVPTVAFTYSYDAVGNVILVGDRINGTNTGQTDYVYDQLNRVTRIAQSGIGVQSKRADMIYDNVNQVTGLTRFSDLNGQNKVAKTSYTYDQNQRLIQLVHKKGVNNLASYDYTYDTADKLTKIVSSIDGTVDYAYDITNQLTGADYSSQTDENYQYDTNGNRTSPSYQTGINNQLLADGQYTYEYDQEGNRIKRTETSTGKMTEYVWDYHNHLTEVLSKGATGVIEKNVEYIYDVNNQRIGKKIDGVVIERFIVERDQISLVFDGQGLQKSRYLYGTKTDQILAEESGSEVYWFLTDHQGTVKDVVDNTGIVIDHINYDSFGKIVGQTNAIDLRFTYTGREWDGETGQYYYRARYYDSNSGRFIGEDPLGFDAGDNNLNRYVSNNPVNYTDANGMYGQIVGGSSRTTGNRVIWYKSAGSPTRIARNNIQQVINASAADPNLTIDYDFTSATISFSNSLVGTGTGENRIQVLGTRRFIGGDDAGHIIGKQLGGDGKNLNNLFGQTTGVNRGLWKDFEGRIRSKVDQVVTEQIPQPPSVCVVPGRRPRRGHRTAYMTVQLNYNLGEVRPFFYSGKATYTVPFPTLTPYPIDSRNPLDYAFLPNT